MTSINVFINTIDYGDCVIRADLWRDALNLIGRWEIIIDPAGNCAFPAHHVLAVKDDVHIQINGATMMWGYIDDILPYLDRKGYHTRLIKLVGRDRGIDLGQHYVSGEWDGIAGDAIIGNAAGSLLRLTPAAPAVPTELTRATIGAAPGNIYYEADRTYIADAVREVLDQVGYDGYVDNTAVGAGNATLNVFAPGASAAAVTLISVFGSPLNNILHIDPVGEQVGQDYKNYVEVHAGSLSDHYTDLNAADWVGTNCAVTNNTAAPPAVPFLNGRNSLKATNNSGINNVCTITLDFALAPIQALYHYTTLDLSEPCRGSYNYLISDAVSAIHSLSIQLQDNLGNIIRFYRAAFGGLAVGGPTVTASLTPNLWRKVDFPLGPGAIEAGLVAADDIGHWWYFLSPAPPFDWSNVEKIMFVNDIANLIPNGEFYCVDGLSFPNLEVHSIQQNNADINANGYRMKPFYEPGIKTQYEINDYATYKLTELLKPKETLHCIAEGQTGTPYAAQTLDVVAPTLGIGGPAIGQTIVYKIMRLHHTVVKNSEESRQPGWTFMTEYDLLRYQYYGTATTQYTEPTKFIATVSPDESMQRETRLRQQHRRRDSNVRLNP